MRSAVRRLALSLLFVVSACAAAAGQSVSPAVVEYPGPAEGSFELRNDGLTPLVVTLEARTFTIDAEGVAHFVELPSALHLELSQSSLRLPPHSRRTVDYTARAESYPAWFTIYANFAGLPRRNGVQVQLELPHTVYLLGGAQPHAAQLQFVRLHSDGSHLLGRMANHGASVVRIHQLEVETGGRRVVGGGFPLLPGGERDFSVDLPPGADAHLVRARLARFTVEQAVR